MNIAHWLARNAQWHPGRDAVLQGHALVLNWAQWDQRSASGAAALRHLGVAPGDRVGLFMSNHPDYLVWLYAVWWAGAVAVPINAKLHPREVAWIADNAHTRVLITHSEHLPPLRALARLQRPRRARRCGWARGSLRRGCG